MYRLPANDIPDGEFICHAQNDNDYIISRDQHVANTIK